jgi:hypothetical protein
LQVAEWCPPLSLCAAQESQGLEDYKEVFRQHRVDFDVMNEMTHETLREMGVHFGDRVRILRAIESLKATPSGDEDR